MQNSEQKHLLTILVEDYFHVGAFENLIQQRNWSNFEPRYERNTLKTLDLLDELKTKATFFVLGWIGEQNPKLIREIVSRGHEVASRGFYHRSLKNLTNEEFREDLRKTNQILEDACGQKIVGYRSAEKLNFEKDSWIFDVLAEEGFVYDEIEVLGDSMLVIKQMSNEWRAKGGMYFSEYQRAVKLRDQFKNISFRWIRRDENSEADQLSRSEVPLL